MSACVVRQLLLCLRKFQAEGINVFIRSFVTGRVGKLLCAETVGKGRL